MTSASPPPPEASADAAAAQELDTGLPGIRSWRTVYGLVFSIFVLWVALLSWLTVAYS
jgi:hypothetical protein